MRPRVVEVSAPGGLPVGPLAGGAEGGEHGPVPHQPQVQTRHVVLRILATQEGELNINSDNPRTLVCHLLY